MRGLFVARAVYTRNLAYSLGISRGACYLFRAQAPGLPLANGGTGGPAAVAGACQRQHATSRRRSAQPRFANDVGVCGAPELVGAPTASHGRHVRAPPVRQQHRAPPTPCHVATDCRSDAGPTINAVNIVSPIIASRRLVSARAESQPRPNPARQSREMK